MSAKHQFPSKQDAKILGQNRPHCFSMQWGPKYNRGPIYIKEWQNLFTHYACTFLTHSSLSADPRFHTKTSGRFMFTWYCCTISYRSENSHSSTTTGVDSSQCDSHGNDILWWYHIKKYTEPLEVTEVNLRRC